MLDVWFLGFADDLDCGAAAPSLDANPDPTRLEAGDAEDL